MKGAVVPIASVKITNNSTTTLDITNIPATYTDLMIIGNVRINADYRFPSHSLYFNGTGATGWSETTMYGDGASMASSRVNSPSICYGLQFVYNIGPVGSIVTENVFSSFIINILNYTSTTTYKTAIGRLAGDGVGMGNTSLVTGLWSNTAAINQIRLEVQGTMKYGSTYTLYGIRSAQ